MRRPTPRQGSTVPVPVLVAAAVAVVLCAFAVPATGLVQGLAEQSRALVPRMTIFSAGSVEDGHFCGRNTSSTEEANCNVEAYVESLVILLLPVALVGTLIFGCGMVFFVGRCFCGCFGGRDPTYGCCMMEQGRPGYKRNQIFCAKATLMVGVVIVAAACVLALIPEAKVAGPLDEARVAILSATANITDDLDIIAATLERRDLNGTWTNATISAGYSSAVNASTKIETYGENLDTFNRFRHIIAMGTLFFVLGLLLLALVAMFFNLNDCSLFLAIMSILVSLVVFAIACSHMFAAFVVADLCVDVAVYHDGFNATSGTGPAVFSGLVCGGGNPLADVEAELAGAIGDWEADLCESMGEICARTNATACGSANANVANCTRAQRFLEPGSLLLNTAMGCTNGTTPLVCPFNGTDLSCGSPLEVCNTGSVTVSSCRNTCHNADLAAAANLWMQSNAALDDLEYSEELLKPLSGCALVDAAIAGQEDHLCDSDLVAYLDEVATTATIAGLGIVIVTVALVLGYKRFHPSRDAFDPKKPNALAAIALARTKFNSTASDGKKKNKGGSGSARRGSRMSSRRYTSSGSESDNPPGAWRGRQAWGESSRSRRRGRGRRQGSGRGSGRRGSNLPPFMDSLSYSDSF